MSACVVLAWCLLALMAAAGVRGPDHPVAQANTSTATSISTANSSTPLTLASDSVTARALGTQGPAPVPSYRRAPAGPRHLDRAAR